MEGYKLYLIIFGIYALVLGLDIVRLIRTIKRPGLRLAALLKYNNRLQLIAFFSGLILTTWLIALHINIFDYQPPIKHSDYRTISLKDFRGLNIPGRKLEGKSTFATIKTTLEIDKADNIVDVQALFHPSRSYVFNKEVQNEDLLTHELFHFHITEVHARILRKLIEKRSIQSMNEINRVYDSVSYLEREMQSKYDYDTYHGYLLSKQKKWQHLIDSTLNSLNTHKHSTDILYR